MIKRNKKKSWARKAKHLNYMHTKILDLHNEIFADALKNKLNLNSIKLIKKYQKRLKLLKY